MQGKLFLALKLIQQTNAKNLPVFKLFNIMGRSRSIQESKNGPGTTVFAGAAA